ncbi:MAG: TolC family protein, partial [Endozoicomonas sp.]|uniref:TolC family protein n=1 Tax=Endozoicomonas sp. TaxID=1892382 RepID=UPI003D9BBCB3
MFFCTSLWWQSFKDPQLNTLIEKALNDNFSLKAATDRLRQAEAVAKQSGAATAPSLNATFDGSHTNQSSGNVDQFQLGLMASYEIDLWSRLAASEASAEFDFLASREELEIAAITLSSEVASHWYELITQQSLIKVGRFAATFCPVQPSNLWEIPVIFFCLSLLTLIPRTAKDRAIKSLIFHVLLFASFVCLAESQTHSYIVELEQNADLPSQNFSIKPEPDTLPAMQMIDMGSLQGKPTEMTNISGYSGSDTPPDDKPYWPRSFWESLTTVVESVTWQLLYASNEVIGYKLLLAFQKDSYQPQPFSWMPVVATVVVGWLTRSNWNPEAPLFNQLDEQ